MNKHIVNNQLVLPRKPKVFLLCGVSESGKSYMLKQIIYQYQKQGYFKYGLIISPTCFTGGYDYIPSEFHWDKYDPKRFQGYLKQISERRKEVGYVEPSFVIIDDSIGSINLADGVLTNFLASYRHYNISFFMLTQYINTGASTLLRAQVSYAMLWNCDQANSLEGFFRAVGGKYKNLKEFMEAFYAATQQDYSCMLYIKDNKAKKDQSYFSFIADSKEPNFKCKF